MAIDTRNKRSSAIHVALPWRGLLPLPDGTVAAADRQHGAMHYSGILADAPPAPGVGGDTGPLIGVNRLLGG